MPEEIKSDIPIAELSKIKLSVDIDDKKALKKFAGLSKTVDNLEKNIEE